MSEAAYNVYVMTLTSTSSRRIVIDERGRLAKAIGASLRVRARRKRDAPVKRGDLWLGDGEQELRGIADVANSLGVTPRTLRFYEDRGLIEPQRVGGARLYSRRDVARMQLILRGKRLGFSLADIQQFLNLYDADPQHIEQMRVLAGRCRERIGELQARREALDQTIGEMERLEREALQRIAQVEGGAKR
jgi:DNA-binding transcriptional MerR regulator